MFFLRYNCQQVLENTSSKRISRPDSAALSCPDSFEFRADGAYREAARPACYGFSTSAHPSCVLENTQFGSEVSVRSMTMQTIASDDDISSLIHKFTYDQETGAIYSANGRLVGSKDTEGYIRVYSRDAVGRRKMLRAHRLAWLLSYGKWPTGDIDHISGIRDDNRLLNLRDVDRQTNAENQRKSTAQNKTTGLLGVSFAKDKKKWLAQIQICGKNKNLGRFDSIEAAHSAYLQAKRQLHTGCTI